MKSNSMQRVVVTEVFDHDVNGTLTGRRVSTPDSDKPELIEVLMDGTENPIWVPQVRTSGQNYAVTVTVPHEGLASPTDAVLSTIEWLRSPQPGGVTFQVFCSDDNITYTVEATHHDEVDEWEATVIDAYAPPKRNSAPGNRNVRSDLIPTAVGGSAT